MIIVWCPKKGIRLPGHGPLARYVKLRIASAPGMPGTFSPPPRVSDPGMHHSTFVTHVPWCMLGSITSGFLWSRWRGKRSRHSRRMRNPQFYVSGKRPMTYLNAGTYHRQHSDNGNKLQLSRDLYDATDRMWCYNDSRHTNTEKYYNNGTDWFLRTDNDNKMTSLSCKPEIFSSAFSWLKPFISNQIALKFVRGGPVDN